MSLTDHTQRSEASGYWGRGLCRKAVGNGVFQLHEANAPPEAVTPHGHERAHIVFVTAGPYVTSVTGENSFIDRPVAVLNPPATWHRDHFVTGRGSFMTVDLDIEGLAEERVRHDLSPRMLQFCHRVASALDEKSSLELEDDLATLASLFAYKRPQDVSGVPTGIELAFEAIMESTEPWTLTMGDLAGIAGVHVNHLPRAFRTRFGISASRLASSRQIELCAAAIATSEEPLADCAARFGFYDQAHMSSRFRKRTGHSPSQWRKKNLSRG